MGVRCLCSEMLVEESEERERTVMQSPAGFEKSFRVDASVQELCQGQLSRSRFILSRQGRCKSLTYIESFHQG